MSHLNASTAWAIAATASSAFLTALILLIIMVFIICALYRLAVRYRGEIARLKLQRANLVAVLDSTVTELQQSEQQRSHFFRLWAQARSALDRTERQLSEARAERRRLHRRIDDLEAEACATLICDFTGCNLSDYSTLLGSRALVTYDDGSSMEVGPPAPMPPDFPPPIDVQAKLINFASHRSVQYTWRRNARTNSNVEYSFNDGPWTKLGSGACNQKLFGISPKEQFVRLQLRNTWADGLIKSVATECLLVAPAFTPTKFTDVTRRAVAE